VTAVVWFLIYQGTDKAKIAKAAYYDVINDATEDKLDRIFHSKPTHAVQTKSHRVRTKSSDEYELIQTGENPWIK